VPRHEDGDGAAAPSPSPARTPARAEPWTAEAVLAVLSPREREVLRTFVAGHPVARTASMLKLSPHTVRNHLKNIFRKLGVRSQLELLRRVPSIDG
jgi:DNA-binding CsgD family transcriptional regulator